MVDKIQSAWGIVYYIDNDTPKYLLIKRHALSKKVERIAPKWKINPWETKEQAAMREVSEETWLDAQHLQIKDKIDTLSLQLYNNQWELWIDKDITFFLMHYTGDRDNVTIQKNEWFLWMYKWATIREVIGLVLYKDLREIYRTAHNKISTIAVKDKFLESF